MGVLKFFAILLLVFVYFRGYESSASERKLLSQIFGDNGTNKLNVMERPVRNDSDVIEVKLKISLTQIIELNTKNSQIHVNLWLGMKWTDYNFKWNPQDFNGINKLNIPSDKLWKPDIRLYNSVDDNLMNQFPTHTVVDHTGMVIWVPPGQYKAKCTLDVTYFPFEVQRCLLRFGIWTYNTKRVDLKTQCHDDDERINQKSCSNETKLNLKYYHQDNTFILMDNSIERKEFVYADEKYAFLDVSLLFRRQANSYMFTFMVPCYLLSFMVLLVFALPSASGQKITLGILVLLALTSLLVAFADKLPPSSPSIPIICQYIASIMVLCALSILFAVIVLNMHHKSANHRPIPIWMKVVINKFLARLLFLTMEGPESKKDDILLTKYENSSSSKDDSPDNMTIIAEELKKISQKYFAEEKHMYMARDWKFAARVVDRFCLLLFTLITVITTIVTLCRPEPNVFDKKIYN